MVRAVLFDLDGTLVDSAPLWRSALTSLVLEREGRLVGDVLEGLVGLTAADALVTVGRRLRWSAEEAAPNARWVEQQVCAGYRNGVVWREGAIGLVRAVRAAGAVTGLVTSSSRQVVEAVLADGRCPVFDAVVSGDDVVAAKPAPDPYLAAVTLLELGPQLSVAVEDSAVGVSSALAAGCAVVAVGRYVACPDMSQCLHVDSLTDVKPEDVVQLQTKHAMASRWQE